MEAAAIQREEAHISRMRNRLPHYSLRGMVGRADERTTWTEGYTAASIQSPVSLQQSLSLAVPPLSTPAPELSSEDAIQWGGSAGLRLVLNHNLRRVSLDSDARRYLLSKVS